MNEHGNWLISMRGEENSQEPLYMENLAVYPTIF